jgi:hypothetical protein
VDKARGDIADLRKSNRYYAGMIDDLRRAVAEIDGKNTTLWSFFESGKFRVLCGACRDADCLGCPDTDPADRETWESER